MDEIKKAIYTLTDVIAAMRHVKVRLEDIGSEGNTLAQCVNQLISTKEQLEKRLEDEMNERSTADSE